jgi:hypothetical protein
MDTEFVIRPPGEIELVGEEPIRAV